MTTRRRFIESIAYGLPVLAAWCGLGGGRKATPVVRREGYCLCGREDVAGRLQTDTFHKDGVREFHSPTRCYRLIPNKRMERVWVSEGNLRLEDCTINFDECCAR